MSRIKSNTCTFEVNLIGDILHIFAYCDFNAIEFTLDWVKLTNVYPYTYRTL